jgi:hypothetical protein
MVRVVAICVEIIASQVPTIVPIIQLKRVSIALKRESIAPKRESSALNGYRLNRADGRCFLGVRLDVRA